MARAINPAATFEFVLPDDRILDADDPARTVWTLRPLTPGEEAKIADSTAFMEGETIGYRSGSTALTTLRIGLQGWRCFLDDDGVDVAWKGKTVSSTVGKRTEATDEDIARIHPQDRRRLCNAISEAGRLGVDEVGKSSPGSTSPTTI